MTRICDIEGCGEKHKAKGLCEKHYFRHHAKSYKKKKEEINRIWREENREKVRAYCTVKEAIMAGRLKKAPCVECGAMKVHAHHDDYTKRLEVRWFCPLHHKEWHKNNIPILS